MYLAKKLSVVALVLLAGYASFLVTRAVAGPPAAVAEGEMPAMVREVSDKISRGEITPRPEPTMTAEQQARFAPLLQATPNPPFVGDLNGFTFYDTFKSRPPHVTDKCERAKGGESAVFVPAEREEASELSFEVSHWPTEVATHPIETIVAACKDQVVSVSKGINKGGRMVNIMRLLGPPVHPAGIPRNMLKPAEVAGMPALIMSHAATRRNTVFLRDTISYWIISCGGVEATVCEDIAQGVRP